ncbi:alanine--tRNA ligase [Anaeramoeba flamelloides]|uniref:Alanine--tRNA ligase n=1 Tax=Anaeramoeba flamelloides TaxID=1746091 RepID=A0ABQ8YGE4_9EUKA|nr:alanine--tRNA ligase [Anaeramoeba flamelloides]
MTEKEPKVLTTKEIKKLARPEFEKNPEKFYPTKVFQKWGFTRARCPKCDHYFWRHSEKVEVCGDSSCVGSYTFIGKGCGIGRKGQKLSYEGAWKTFKKSFENAKIPHTAIKRYPVVARWRPDVEYVAAGIYNFQPFCVTGEMDPPANPLIDAQFCLRFNDLDNIGITGRHYSGFNMLGVQVFNKPQKYVYFKEECVEFNLKWLTEELEIDLDEITLIEDVWAGGGNLGPSIEYFVGGLELGNMVFMQYKTHHNGTREPLQVQVIDVGIGLERIPWVVNGSLTSYFDVFPLAIEKLIKMTQAKINYDILKKFAPYSCLLDVDEAEGNVSEIWDSIAKKCNLTKEELLEGISVAKDVFLVCDHTRALLVAIEDGSLPSNVGGASNLRNILRRTFAVCTKRGWMAKMGMDGLMELFQCHKTELTPIMGEFKEYKSFRSIIEIEYKRWLNTDSDSKKKLDRLLKKKKGKLAPEDWLLSITSFGLDPEQIASLTGLKIPDNLYYMIADRYERMVPPPPENLYQLAHLEPTAELWNSLENKFQFEGFKIVQVLENKTDNDKLNIIILDKSLFYPTSGGQMNDTGKVSFVCNKGEKPMEFDVIDVQKNAKSILLFLDKEIPTKDPKSLIGTQVSGSVNEQRRKQLKMHHTATHIVSAAAKKILGPHVWQHGAKKTEKRARLDITHYSTLSFEEERAIENEANRVIQLGLKVNKYDLEKKEAEKKYGFILYQGGIVPENTLRIVEINGIDIEACCGTHVDNTADISLIRIINSRRISDGVLRIYFVAYARALDFTNEESDIVHDLCTQWSCPPKDISQTGKRFFEAFKQNKKKINDMSVSIINLSINSMLKQESKNFICRSNLDYRHLISNVPQFAQQLKELEKSIIFYSQEYIFGLIANTNLDINKLKAIVIGDPKVQKRQKNSSKKISFVMKNKVMAKIKGRKKKVAIQINQISSFGDQKIVQIQKFLLENGFVEFN